MKVLVSSLLALNFALANTVVKYTGKNKKNEQAQCGLELKLDDKNVVYEAEGYYTEPGEYAHVAHYNNRDDVEYNDATVNAKMKDGNLQKLKATATSAIFSGLPYFTLSVKDFGLDKMKADIAVATTNELGFSWMSKRTCDKLKKEN